MKIMDSYLISSVKSSSYLLYAFLRERFPEVEGFLVIFTLLSKFIKQSTIINDNFHAKQKQFLRSFVLKKIKTHLDILFEKRAEMMMKSQKMM